MKRRSIPGMSCSRGLSSHRCFLPLNVGSSLGKTARVLVRSGAGPAFHNTPLGSSVLREEGGDMFAKLITLLLQSKAAALTGVFVIGTTGALVSATTQNGVTTVTITQTSPTTVVESPSPVASLNSNLMPVSSPTTLTPSATPCYDQATARAFPGTGPKAIADEAVAAMKLAFETAKNSVPNQVTTPTSPRKPEPKHEGDRSRHDDKGHH